MSGIAQAYLIYGSLEKGNKRIKKLCKKLKIPHDKEDLGKGGEDDRKISLQIMTKIDAYLKKKGCARRFYVECRELSGEWRIGFELGFASVETHEYSFNKAGRTKIITKEEKKIMKKINKKYKIIKKLDYIMFAVNIE